MLADAGAALVDLPTDLLGDLGDRPAHVGGVLLGVEPRALDVDVRLGLVAGGDRRVALLGEDHVTGGKLGDHAGDLLKSSLDMLAKFFRDFDVQAGNRDPHGAPLGRWLGTAMLRTAGDVHKARV